MNIPFRYDLLAVLLLSTSLPALAQTQDTSRDAFLRPGDALRLTVWRNPELSGDFTILADGAIGHPLLHDLKVSGRQITDVEADLRTFLKRYDAEPRFVVQPLYRILVGGEVRNPSVYQLPPTATLAEAVATAGGVTDRARLESVRLQRDGATTRIDLTDPRATAVANSPIHSGDQLFVERRVSVFREYIAPAGSITAALAAIANMIFK